METFNQWIRHPNKLQVAFVFSTFAISIAFVNDVAEYAEELNLHPLIAVNARKVGLIVPANQIGEQMAIGINHIYKKYNP